MQIDFWFFNRWRDLRLGKKLKLNIPHEPLHKNIDWMVAEVVARRLATLRELQQYYSLEDLYLMWEALAVDNFERAQT